MKEILNKSKCTGCTACMNVCPRSAISMVDNGDGFKYLVIDQNKCINCGLCKRTCPVLNTIKNDSLNKCYVGYNKDEDLRFKSSSGGIFSIIANYFLENDGVVIGSAFDDDNKLKHIAVTKKEELFKVMGSKYLQSDLDNIFTYIKDNLKNKKILFVGTPCQVAGLKSFLKKDYDNLLCIDLFCHGVPSPKLFEKYVGELEKNNGTLINYWDTYSNTATFKNKKITELRKDNDYMKLFLSDIALRESCYSCNFKLGNKYSDITLGDFWGVKKFYPEMYNNKGVSAIIINTLKGKNMFNIISDFIDYKECKLEEIISGNSSLIKSANLPLKRKKFFNDVDKMSVQNLRKKYLKVSLGKKIAKKLRFNK